MNLRQHANGRVTLHCERWELASLIQDAAKAMTGSSEPLREDILRVAGEFSEFEVTHYPDSGDVYLLRDVEKSLGGR
jgi:hypothetical protein